MNQILSNIFGSPRTTLAGLWGTVAAPLGMYVVPEVVKYLGGQPGIGWQVVGMLLGLVVPLVMRDAKKPAGS